MIISVQAVAAAAQQVPGYCTSGHGITNQQQWKTCWNLGYNQPVNSTVTGVGHAVGTGALPAVLVIAAILVVIALLRRGSGSPATS